LLFTYDVDELTAQYQLGHSDLKTTMSIYTHLQEQKKQRSIQSLNDGLKKKFM
jgi:integrase